MPGFIDTHSHLYLPEFDIDRNQTVERALATGVKKILLPNIDSSSIAAMNRLANEYSGICHAMIGLHPTSVKENYRDELDIMETELKNRGYCAVCVTWRPCVLKYFSSSIFINEIALRNDEPLFTSLFVQGFESVISGSVPLLASDNEVFSLILSAFRTSNIICYDI